MSARSPMRWWQVVIAGAFLLFAVQAANIVWIMADDIGARDRVICATLEDLADTSNQRAEALKRWLAVDIKLHASLAVVSRTRAERLLREEASGDQERLLTMVKTVAMPDCTFSNVSDSRE